MVFAIVALSLQAGLGVGRPMASDTGARGPANGIFFESLLICTADGLVEYEPEADDGQEPAHAFPHCPLCLNGKAHIAGVIPHPIHLPAGCARSSQVAYEELDFRPQAGTQGDFRSRAPPLFS